MKRYYLKSYLPKLSCLFLLMLTLLLVHSCKKESYQDISLSGEVDQAKSWYDSAYPAGTTVGHVAANASGANNVDLTQLTRPDWQHTASYSRFGKNVIEMPADPAHKLASAFRNANTGKVGSNKFSKTSFLLLKGSTGYQAYLMVIIADSAYLKGDFNKLNRNSYHKRDSDFTGDVLYFTPSGQYLRGYAYKNGHPLKPAAVTAVAGTTLKTTGSGKLQPTALSCVAWFMGHYINGELVSYDYMYTICTGDDEGAGGGGTPAPPAPLCPPGTSAITPGSKLHVLDDSGIPSDGLPPDGGDGFPPPDAPVDDPCVAPLPKPIVDSINSKFPCAKQILAAIPGLQTKLSTLLDATFNSSTSFTVIFHDGDPTFYASHPDEDGDTKYNNNVNSIYLNPNILANASNEYILVTMYHEALHAYLNVEYTTLGDAAFKAKYPSINITTSWHFGNMGNIIDDFWIDEGAIMTQVDSDPQHRTMAEYFTSSLISAILSYNPSFDPNRAKDLARWGIFKDSSASQSNVQEKDMRNGESKGTTCPK